MGFFSWNCKKCGHPLLSVYAINEINGWMVNAVALLPTGAVHIGEYDGYGRINGAEIHFEGEPEVYHEACWELAGKPLEFTEPSEHAEDQGYFFDNDHDLPEPTKAAGAKA